MTVAIIDYGSANLHSAAKAFERAARESGFRGNVIVTSEADRVAAAERVVLPGVGAFADCRRGLHAVPGMVDALTDAVIKKGKPFLGICVGMQLMAERGLENGEHAGLGWLQGNVVALTPEGSGSPANTGWRIPLMGWNDLQIEAPHHPMLAGINGGEDVYCVHSYHMQCHSPDNVLATYSYGQAVTAMVGRDNMVGTQFHPEKSQDVGLRFISNFLAWKP
jgi:imidazole glycerol-phosphate synthase subunit HisH